MLRVCCFALSTLVLVACGDDSTAPSGGSGGGTPSAGASPGGSSEGGSSGVAGGEPQGGADGGNGGAEPIGGNAPLCDGDGDQAPLMGAGCCGAPDPCDCDDNDSNVFPDQAMFFDVPRPFEDDPIKQWDYDCDGLATKQYPQAADGCGPLACIATTTEFQGNNGDYFCGAPGTLIVCAGIGLQCQVQGGVILACN